MKSRSKLAILLLAGLLAPHRLPIARSAEPPDLGTRKKGVDWPQFLGADRR